MSLLGLVRTAKSHPALAHHWLRPMAEDAGIKLGYLIVVEMKGSQIGVRW